MNREQLWDAAIVEAREHWTDGSLIAGDRHCVVGILGYIKYGEQWNEDLRAYYTTGQWRGQTLLLENGGHNPYTTVGADPDLGPMALALTAAINEQHPEKNYACTKPMAAVLILVEYNDRMAKTGDNLAAMMEKAKYDA